MPRFVVIEIMETGADGYASNFTSAGDAEEAARMHAEEYYGSVEDAQGAFDKLYVFELGRPSAKFELVPPVDARLKRTR